MTTLGKEPRGWSAGNVLRRNFRAAHNGPETGRHRSRKNTAKWCRGKVGVPHEGHWQEWDYSFMKLWNRPPVMVSVCENCGKRLEMLWPPQDTFPPRPTS